MKQNRLPMLPEASKFVIFTEGSVDCPNPDIGRGSDRSAADSRDYYNVWPHNFGRNFIFLDGHCEWFRRYSSINKVLGLL